MLPDLPRQGRAVRVRGAVQQVAGAPQVGRRQEGFAPVQAQPGSFQELARVLGRLQLPVQLGQPGMLRDKGRQLSRRLRQQGLRVKDQVAQR